MRMIELKEIRENIACPQLGDDHYGKWGALPLEVRLAIMDLVTDNERMGKGYDEMIRNEYEFDEKIKPQIMEYENIVIPTENIKGFVQDCFGIVTLKLGGDDMGRILFFKDRKEEGKWRGKNGRNKTTKD